MNTVRVAAVRVMPLETETSVLGISHHGNEVSV
jgi:hypothetical protein